MFKVEKSNDTEGCLHKILEISAHRRPAFFAVLTLLLQPACAHAHDASIAYITSAGVFVVVGLVCGLLAGALRWRPVKSYCYGVATASVLLILIYVSAGFPQEMDNFLGGIFVLVLIGFIPGGVAATIGWGVAWSVRRLFNSSAK